VCCGGWSLPAHQAISIVATPAKEVARTSSRLAADFRDAATEAAKVPGVGDQLRRPFDAAASTLNGLIASAEHQVANLEQLATLVGWLVFLIPVSVVVAFWLPRRIRFWRRPRPHESSRPGADLDLFALRAMVTQPMHAMRHQRRSGRGLAWWRPGSNHPTGGDRTRPQRTSAPGKLAYLVGVSQG
jgi:hypothetical protein